MLTSGFYMNTNLNAQMHIYNKLKKTVKKK